MCGIAGFAGGGEVSDLHAMLQSLRLRGPDGAGDWLHATERVFLGHRRLAVIDVPGGSQPMATRDGMLVVTFNGEIYNHVELRRQLEAAGHTFVTDHSDTEVLLHGYREWGSDLPNRLNGMWAFAIYDVGRRRLLLSRDRFGQKPVYYTVQNGTFVFASEASALAEHRLVTASISPLSVCKYFAYGFIPAPVSLYERISKLPGGHNLWCNVDTLQIRVERYWDFVLEPDERPSLNHVQELGEELRELLRAAVHRHMISDVPIGTFLSGGLDSSAITRFAVESTGGRPLPSFCLGFQDAEFDEAANARRVATELGTAHTELVFKESDFEAVARGAIDGLDEPLADSSLIPTSQLCRAARQHITVAVGGDGADELFCGYDTFRAARLAERYARCMPRPLHAAIRAAFAWLPDGHGYMSLSYRLRRMLRGLSYAPRLWNPVWLGGLEPSEFDKCFVDAVDHEEIYSEAIDLWDSSPALDAVDRTMQFYVKLYFANGILTKLDRAGMQHGLEMRCPFLDVDLVEFITRLPQSLRCGGSRGKYLLRKSMQGLLSEDTVNQAKHGFPFPVAKWFKSGQISHDGIRPLPNQQAGFFEGRLHSHLHGCAMSGCCYGVNGCSINS